MTVSRARRDRLRASRVRSRLAAPDRRPGLAVRALGDFEVRRRDGQVASGDWARRKAMELLWLLCSREPHSVLREEAIELLWPGLGAGDATGPAERPIRHAGQVRLRVTLHALRTALEPCRIARAESPFVHTIGARVILDRSVWVDADEFRRLGQRVLSEPDAGARLELGRTALALYRGPFLPDARSLEWTHEPREALRVLHVDVLLRSAAAELGRRDFAAAADLARRAGREDPYREAACRILAQAHRCAGDNAAAWQVYADCRARLWADLRVEPSWRPDEPLDAAISAGAPRSPRRRDGAPRER